MNDVGKRHGIQIVAPVSAIAAHDDQIGGSQDTDVFRDGLPGDGQTVALLAEGHAAAMAEPVSRSSPRV